MAEINWNTEFTALIRRTRTMHWGNWGLDPFIRPGAVGMIDPMSGSFHLVADEIPGASLDDMKAATSQWKITSAHTSESSAKVELDASAIDPETGTKVDAGTKISWGLEKAGSMISRFRVEGEQQLANWARVLAENLDWLAEQAESVSMGSEGRISQGFGVVTSVIWANSGLNVGAMSDGTTFSVEGEVGAVNDLVGGSDGGGTIGARAKGSYSATSSNKSVDQHIWPDKTNSRSAEHVPIAFTFASFAGRAVIPNWIRELTSLHLMVQNEWGCSYVIRNEVSYDTPAGHKHEPAEALSAGLVKSFSLPLYATNIKLSVEFVGLGILANQKERFEWLHPLGEWVGGDRLISVTGLWPSAGTAVIKETRLSA